MKILFLAVVWFAIGAVVGSYTSSPPNHISTRKRPVRIAYSNEFAEALDPQGPFSSEGSDEFKTNSGKMLVALKRAGLVGNTLDNVDYGVSWSLLNDLVRTNPRNAAFLYYRLAVEILAAHPTTQIEKTGFDILKSNSYDNPFASLKNRLIRETTLGHIAAAQVLSDFPQIDDVSILASAQGYLSQATSVRKHLAKLMSRSSSVLNGPAAAILDIDHVGNTIGTNIVYNVCPRIELASVATLKERSRNVFASY